MKNPSPDPGRVRLDADFSSFVAARSGRLLHAADLLTGSRARAEDLVQHALAQAYLRWNSICEGNPEGYVRKVMLHAYLDWWRRVRPREVLDAGAGRALQVPDFAPEVARRAVVQQALQRLTNACDVPSHQSCDDHVRATKDPRLGQLYWAETPLLASEMVDPADVRRVAFEGSRAAFACSAECVRD